MKEYKKLEKTVDIEKLRELAELKTEVNGLINRIKMLEDLWSDNSDLHSMLWTTKEGKVIPIPDLEDSHLQNIVSYIGSNRGHNKEIQREYMRRFPDRPITINYDDAEYSDTYDQEYYF